MIANCTGNDDPTIELVSSAITSNIAISHYVWEAFPTGCLTRSIANRYPADFHVIACRNCENPERLRKREDGTAVRVEPGDADSNRVTVDGPDENNVTLGLNDNRVGPVITTQEIHEDLMTVSEP